MPPPVIGVLGLGLAALGTIGGMAGAAKAAEQSEAAYKASLEEKHRAYEFNIGQTEQEIGGIKYAGQERRSDIRREGDQFLRGQAAAIGASGAVIGTGSPLMTMIDTAETIERDILREQRIEDIGVSMKEDEIEFMEGEVEELEGILGIGEDEEKKKPKSKKTKKPGYSTSLSGPGPGHGATYQ